MLALFVVVAMAVVAGVAVLVVRDRPLITDDPVGSRALDWSAQDGVSPQDLATVRFAVVLRGYRMDEVDRVLDDTREALADRDARIADLQRVVAALGGTPAGDAAGVQGVDSAAPAPDAATGAQGAEDRATGASSRDGGAVGADSPVAAGADGAEELDPDSAGVPGAEGAEVRP